MCENSLSSVISNEDYLGEICKFLRLDEMFGIIGVVSSWHYQFLNNCERKKLIDECLRRETRSLSRKAKSTIKIGEILKKFNIELKCNRSDHPHQMSLSEQINMILKNYRDWIHFYDNAMSTDDNTKYHMKQLQSNVESIHHPFACYGSIDIDDKNPPLLHVVEDEDEIQSDNNSSDRNCNHMRRSLTFKINSNVFSNQEIEKLKSLMKPALFAYKNKTKFDPSYRNALQLPNTLFSFSFNTQREKLNILDKIKNILMVDPQYDIFCEPYKLNFMSKGGFFKPHVDTPHAHEFFGTLVLCLPISKFEGGNLMIWNNGNNNENNNNNNNEKKIDCDFAKSSFKKEKKSTIEWCAFYGDCGHEILEVTAGHRITITFNLYTKEIDSHLIKQYLSQQKNNDTFGIDPYNLLTFEQNLYFALMSCRFLPNGGQMAFGCTSKYPVKKLNDDNVNIHMCKGVDGLVMSCIKKFNLSYQVVPVVNRHRDMLKARSFPDAGSYAWMEGDDHGSSDDLTVLIDSKDAYSYRSNVEIVNWLNDIKKCATQGIQAEFYYGNCADDNHYYAYAVILIQIPAFWKRIQSL